MAINVGTIITAGATVYEIKSVIKAGGFGTTFLAERTAPSPGRFVVKVPHPKWLADATWSQKFAREARILGNISHRNVVSLVAFHEFPATGDKALVQEIVESAVDLSAFIAANPTSAASLLLQSLYALRAVHHVHKVVHRDLSPSNILVAPNGLVKVIDFGLAKEDPRLTVALTAFGQGFGTPGCISPEQRTNAANVDHRTDLFSLGKSFGAAIQGRDPDHVEFHLLAEPWRTICQRLAQHKAADRYQSAEEALTDVMRLFASSKTPIEHWDFHVREMRPIPWSSEPVFPGWPELCESHYLALPDYDQEHIVEMHRLHHDVFGPPVNANALIDRLEASSAIQSFATGFVTFDDADPLGELYQRIYKHLDVPHKLVCFSRLCKTAIRFHRYSVMQDVRNAYRDETDPKVQAQLLAILDTEDPPPSPTIEGRGVIPRTP